MDSIEPTNADEWRAGLKSNHLTSREIWLGLTKGGKEGRALTMREAIDEALYFGWIDSRSKRLDDSRFMLRLTPRKDATKWSQRNLHRAAHLVEEGRMTEAGMAKLPGDFSASIVPSGASLEKEEMVPPELEKELNRDTAAGNAFLRLAPGKRKEFIRWVSSAKRLDTRQERSEKAVELIRMGRSLTEEMMGKWSKR